LASIGSLLACSSATDGVLVDGSGGRATGGTSAEGGASTTGGSSAGTGGARSGGAPGSGGTLGRGGTTGSGGATATGGTSTLPGSGGATRSTGGTPSTGGATVAAGRDGGDSGATGGSAGITGKGGTAGTSTGGTAGPPTGGSGGARTGGSTGAGGSTGSGGKAGTGGSTVGSSLCPSGITQTITVAKDGSGQFSTVQAAVNSIASGSSSPIRIDIKAGTYTEKLTIASRTNLCLVGASATSTILTYGDSNASVGSTSGSASVLISANDFSAANLTIANSYGTGSQAVALRTTGQRQQFLGCRFIGNQDTLYTHNGSQYFRNCYVEGTVDYVFGGATAVFQSCEVHNVGGGSATTAPNTDIGTSYGIVYLGGKLTAASSVKAGSVALARPWGADGFAAFLDAELGAHISTEGFTTMSSNDPKKARFHEYGSTGAGANASSRSSYQLTATQAASYTLATILGSWTPSYSQ
jgi:pectin methylesterase-like acyl-CoA thioesterase